MRHSAYTPNSVRIVFGTGCSESLAGEAAGMGLTRSAIICSPGRAKLASDLTRELEPDGAVICAAARPNFPQSAFDEVMKAIDASCANGLIAIGGGTSIGLAKAIATATKLPLIAVPTTYSGSELASNWYVGVGPSRHGGRDCSALPKTVLYDPALFVGLSATTTAASGMNAMAHAVESLYGPDTNPVIDIMAEKAIRLLATSLPLAVDHPADLNARSGALRGAWFAAGFRSRSGLEHIMAQRIRDAFDFDHAVTHAVVLPYVVAFNAPNAAAPIGHIARALGVSDAADGLHQLNRRLGLTTGFRDLGMPESGIDEAVQQVLASHFDNPRPAGKSEIHRIVEAAFAGEPPDISNLDRA